MGALNLGRTVVINRRELAAIDIAFLGSKFIIAEFAAGVLLCAALGAFTILSAGSLGQRALGLYLICLGIDYVPMLVYAIATTRGQSERAEIGEELSNSRRAMAKYRWQSIFLLQPLLVPVIALQDFLAKPSAPHR
jgi:hypothetical protein